MVNPKRCYYEVWDKDTKQMVPCGKRAVDSISFDSIDGSLINSENNCNAPLCEEHIGAVKLALFKGRE